jgi:NAD(P)-dependent dehydrogenase (short-subunit alcohol dehydrogenase family)
MGTMSNTASKIEHAQQAGRGRMNDRVALVFGAGLPKSNQPQLAWSNGAAAAALYAREGAKVVVVDLVHDAAEATRAIIEKEGGTAMACTADVTKSDEVAVIVARTVETYGRIDVLHNNVGATVMGSPTDVSEDNWQRGLDLNLTSAFLTCKHVLPVMLAQGKGAIVNISSVAAVVIGNYPYASYYASKAGLNHFTRSVALHYAAKGIRANAVMPGLIDTPLIYREILTEYASVDEMLRARNAKSPTGKMGDVWDVAYAALFLASDEAKYVNGVCLAVDGGLTCL